MAVATAPACEWAGHINEQFSFSDFPRGARVLDIGFGGGEQLTRVAARGCQSVGIEVAPELARRGRASGLTVCRAVAERLPFANAGFDGVICKVVVPYTDEALAVRELARVLRPGGIARVSYHGLGYYLRYLLTDPNWKIRIYGARSIVNTLVYATTGRRLPGFWGDTTFQAQRRLRGYYAEAGLELIDDRPAPTFIGAPVFIYHVLRRRSGESL
jgi:SAM-dependent methyltransferase